jgi:anti-sigma B factor antagonist
VHVTDTSFISSAAAAGVVRVAVTGEIDMATSQALATALREAVRTEDAKEVEVDLSGVTFMDSSGIRALVMSQGYATEHGVTLYATNPHPHVRRVLEITGLLTLLTEPAPGTSD